MSNLLPFFVMSDLQAARLRELTQGQESRLEPRRIEGGPHAGKYALPKRIAHSPDFEAHFDAFALLTEVALDADLAWPPSPDE